MKYQRLSSAELDNLREDFIRFIASQGIDADAWQKMKAQSQEEANEIIEIYSDLVYDQALTKCIYLEHVSAKEFKAIHFLDGQAIVVGVKVKPESIINLNTSGFKESVQQGLGNNEIEVFSATKKYEGIRELEMFDWIKKGAYMANEDWYTEITRLINHLQ